MADPNNTVKIEDLRQASGMRLASAWASWHDPGRSAAVMDKVFSSQRTRLHALSRNRSISGKTQRRRSTTSCKAHLLTVARTPCTHRHCLLVLLQCSPLIKGRRSCEWYRMTQ